MPLWEIRAELAPGSADAVDAALLEAGDADWMLVEDVDARRAWIVGTFGEPDEARSRWESLRSRLSLAASAEPRLLPDEDWKNAYRAHFHPWSFGELHWVPIWERQTYRAAPGDAILWLDPGLAFGTGNHETTRLCIERLVQLVSAGLSVYERRPLVDAGCGSGILALSAALLGFQTVSAFDNDPEAIRVSLENAEANGLGQRVRFETAGLEEGLRGAEAGVILANIQADVLVGHGAVLLEALGTGGVLIMSGILASEIEAVRRHFEAEAPGWQTQSRTLGEWSDLVLSRP